MENTQQLDREGPSSKRSANMIAGSWDQEAMAINSSIRAANANIAAYHAEVAANHAASLAQWVQHLVATLTRLQGKVTELEDWKRRALEEMRKLQEEHEALRMIALQQEMAASLQPQEGSGNEESPAAFSPSSLDPGATWATPDTREVTMPVTPQDASQMESTSSGDVSALQAHGLAVLSMMRSSQDLDAAIRQEDIQVNGAVTDDVTC